MEKNKSTPEDVLWRDPAGEDALLNRLGRDLEKLQRDLEYKRKENYNLLGRIKNLEDRCYIQTARNNLASLSDKNTSTEDVFQPRLLDPPPENSCPLSQPISKFSSEINISSSYQILSEMTAPMLRRFIRRLQLQLNSLEEENVQLRKKLAAEDSDGQSMSSNENCSCSDMSVKLLRIENDELNVQLLACKRKLEILLRKFGVYNESSTEYEPLLSGRHTQNENGKSGSLPTKSEEHNTKGRQTIGREKSLECETNPQHFVKLRREMQNSELRNKGFQTSLSDASTQTETADSEIAIKSSQRLKQSKSQEQPACRNPHVDNPDVLRLLLSEAATRIQRLEDKLSGTEGTVRLQTQKMKYYKSLLEDHGLMSKSPRLSRPKSESNLLFPRNSRKIQMRENVASSAAPVSLGIKDDSYSSIS